MMLIPRLPLQYSKFSDLELRRPSVPQLQLTYAITPPNQSTSIERRKAIAALQSERIAALPIDALLVYDLQDESSRNGAPRPFPYLPKVDALSYAYDELRLGIVPRVVYRAIANEDEAQLQGWLSRLQALGGHPVLVGAPSRTSLGGLSLSRAMAHCSQHLPFLAFGGVLIAERHQSTGAEDVRVWSKMQSGCRFFVSQTVWSAHATNELLRALRLSAERFGRQLPQVVVTLSPCGSEQTLLLQEWLGVNVPTEVRQQLLSAKDMLARSVELAVQVFAEIRAFASEQGVPLGCNVESVSSRADEVAASLELTQRIAQIQGRGNLSHVVPVSALKA
jgi:hypothetical protein